MTTTPPRCTLSPPLRPSGCRQSSAAAAGGVRESRDASLAALGSMVLHRCAACLQSWLWGCRGVASAVHALLWQAAPLWLPCLAHAAGSGLLWGSKQAAAAAPCVAAAPLCEHCLALLTAAACWPCPPSKPPIPSPPTSTGRLYCPSVKFYSTGHHLPRVEDEHCPGTLPCPCQGGQERCLATEGGTIDIPQGNTTVVQVGLALECLPGCCNRP